MRFSTTNVSAPTTSAASIQYSAGLPLNKKAVTIIADAQRSDQITGHILGLLEPGGISRIVALLWRTCVASRPCDHARLTVHLRKVDGEFKLTCGPALEGVGPLGMRSTTGRSPRTALQSRPCPQRGRYGLFPSSLRRYRFVRAPPKTFGRLPLRFLPGRK